MTENNKKEEENQEGEVKVSELEEEHAKKSIPTVPPHKSSPSFPNGNHFKNFHQNTMHSPQRQGRGASRGR